MVWEQVMPRSQDQISYSMLWNPNPVINSAWTAPFYEFLMYPGLIDYLGDNTRGILKFLNLMIAAAKYLPCSSHLDWLKSE